MGDKNIDVGFNSVGMIIFSCNHVNGYNKGKGKNICNRCMRKIIKRMDKILQ